MDGKKWLSVTEEQEARFKGKGGISLAWIVGNYFSINDAIDQI